MTQLEQADSKQRRQRAPRAHQVGTIHELWRYPVKSMLGTTVNEILITEHGALGDRAWALRDVESGRIASAKKFPRLLEFRATYEVEPTFDKRGRVRIETPDGQAVDPEDPDASRLISNILGRTLQLENQAHEDEKTSIDRKTVFGDVPISEMKPDWTPDTMPDYFQLMKNSFLEIGPLFVLASGSVEHLLKLQGGTAQIDRRRFRPNLFVDTAPETDRFIEDEWIGGTLGVGETLALDEIQPTLWCVTSTLAQEELPRDLSILRTAAKAHKGCLGVYACVRTPGVARVGDPVVLLHATPAQSV
jgi:MOSC domain-containing protein